MSEPPPKSPVLPAKVVDEREARRAAALRENLRRRKTQARARQDAEKPAPERDGQAAEIDPGRVAGAAGRRTD